MRQGLPGRVQPVAHQGDHRGQMADVIRQTEAHSPVRSEPMVLHSLSLPGKGTARHTRSCHFGEALSRSARRIQYEAVSDDIRGARATAFYLRPHDIKTL